MIAIALAQQRLGADLSAQLEEFHQQDLKAYTQSRQEEAKQWMREKPRPTEYNNHDAQQGIDLLAWFATRIYDPQWQQSEESQWLCEHQRLPVQHWSEPKFWRPFQQHLEQLFRLAIEHEFDRRPPLLRSEPGKRVLQNALLVTHPTSRYDSDQAAKAGIDIQIAKARKLGWTVVFLLSPPYCYQNAFVSDCRVMPLATPDLALNSECGEHNIAVEGSCVVVGGYFANCLMTTAENLSRHCQCPPMRVELPKDAIFCQRQLNPDYHGEWYESEFIGSKLLSSLSSQDLEKAIDEIHLTIRVGFEVQVNGVPIHKPTVPARLVLNITD